MALREYCPLYLSLGPALEPLAHPKPGNVHRLRDLEDSRLEDFIVGSTVLENVLLRAYSIGHRRGVVEGVIGRLVREAVELSMQIHGGGNTCLGTALLLVPLSLACGAIEGGLPPQGLCAAATDVVRRAGVEDSVEFYRAVRVASPSYIKAYRPVELPDVFSPNFENELRSRSLKLFEVLRLSSPVDPVAADVVEGYPRSLEAKEYLRRLLREGFDWNVSVVATYLYTLHRHGDSVLRRLSKEVEQRVRDMAGEVLGLLGDEERFSQELRRLDEYLRTRRLNPGGAADITAVAISLLAIDEGRVIRFP